MFLFPGSEKNTFFGRTWGECCHSTAAGAGHRGRERWSEPRGSAAPSVRGRMSHSGAQLARTPTVMADDPDWNSGENCGTTFLGILPEGCDAGQYKADPSSTCCSWPRPRLRDLNSSTISAVPRSCLAHVRPRTTTQATSLGTLRDSSETAHASTWGKCSSEARTSRTQPPKTWRAGNCSSRAQVAHPTHATATAERSWPRAFASSWPASGLVW